MFNTNSESTDALLDATIKSTFTALEARGADTDEFDKIANQIIKLMKLKQETNPSWRPSPDALVAAIATIGTAFLVLNFEKAGVVTSKAFGFIGKLIR